MRVEGRTDLLTAACHHRAHGVITFMQVKGDGAGRPGKRLLAGEALMAGLHRVTELDRWKKDDGASFVFFEPHPISADELSGTEYRQFMCSIAKHSMHIVGERGQRNICQVPCREQTPVCKLCGEQQRALQPCARWQWSFAMSWESHVCDLLA